MLSHSCGAILDIPVYLIGLSLVLTVYRLPNLVHSFSEKDLGEKRMLILQDVLGLLMDLPCFVLALCLLLTPWRLLLFIRDISASPPDTTWISNGKARYHLCHLFCLALMDPIAIVAGLVSLIPIYRIPRLWRDYQTTHGMFFPPTIGQDQDDMARFQVLSL